MLKAFTNNASAIYSADSSNLSDDRNVHDDWQSWMKGDRWARVSMDRILYVMTASLNGNKGTVLLSS